MLKKLSPVLVLLALVLFIFFFFYFLIPRNVTSEDIAEGKFSTMRAFEHVEEMSKNPHFVGSRAHSSVRNYLVNQLQDLGLEVQVQEGYTISEEGVLSRPQNILARIPGSEEGKSLLLMSHYDSAPHSSFGASDAASGVATILEGVRAFKKNGETNKNEIIILFTDAEELGLNGAELFVNNHPWAENVGLALNFESRGSGGASFVLLETNEGNEQLVRHLKKADPDYPVAFSLAYSIYKMLPNDTDLTVLREEANIQGLNFAFIGDHFDYHTANDTPENLDKETLAHQGSYLVPLLEHFKDADLSELNSDEDYVYLSFPSGEILSYPFSWIFPMLLIAVVLFLLVVGIGLFKKKLFLPSVLKGSLPFFAGLIGAGLLVYLLWLFCLMIYPGYREMEHGFTYNGYWYIAAAVFLTLTINFLIYNRFRDVGKQAGLFVFPLFFWLLICVLIAGYLKGAAYFVIPVYFGCLQLVLMMFQKRPNLFLMLFLSLPSVMILLPYVVDFPVALGLKILFVASILTSFLFYFLLPVFGYFSGKKALGILCFLIFNVLFIIAHFKSDFTAERPKPNSLVYILDSDTETAKWASYDGIVDLWTQKYFGEEPVIKEGDANFASKYGSELTFSSEAPLIDIPEPGVVFKEVKNEDSLAASKRYSLKIAPNRKVHRMDLYVDRTVDFENFTVNDLQPDSIYLGAYPFHVFSKRWNNRLLTYHASNQDTLRLEFSLKEGEKVPEFVLYESSYDLLDNEKLGVDPRPEKMIPRPFVLNDAVVIKKTINFGEPLEVSGELTEKK